MLFFVFLNRGGIIAAFVLIYQSHPSLFPTLFATTSFGIVNFIARILVILAPLIAENPFPMPELVTVVLQVLMTFAVLFLIEPNQNASLKAKSL